MILKYAREELDRKAGTNAIFLAGPTPRKQEVESWRPKALEILKELGYEGTVYIPEDRDGTVKGDYLDQVEWEKEGLTDADVIVFWVPRELKGMPAFTTNVEFGYWANSGKIVYGRPLGAPKTKYLDWMYKTEYDNKEPYSDLKETLKEAVNILEKSLL
ncbi:MAG: nucleoside 2-deoxyribosyltransferase domain-containing protein [Clostridia bacterium]|jgi:nucleoside 2-deoxyribosyltransferase|nr:nucleoside 2-deoxyribosyltransferase domain-containing protein [Clostridia bacterium]